MEWKRCKTLLLDSYLNSEKLFYQIGLSIGKKPWVWLIASLCVSGACAPGLLLWREELDEVELFMPKESIVRSDASWVKKNFRDDLRYESIIVEAPNVLDPKVLEAISEIEEDVKSIKVDNYTWYDVCAGYLTWFNNDNLTNKTLGDEWQAIFHELNGTVLKHDCIYQSIIKLWKVTDIKNISHFTKDYILDKITAAMNNNSHSILLDVAPLLSRVKYDERNRITGAQATVLNWLLKMSHPHSVDWELEFINRILDANRSLPCGMHVYVIASRSYDDFLREVLNSNMTILFCGLSLLVVYVITMIGRCNVVQQRIYLSLMSISVVGQAILCSYGLCYYLGYSYGPVHPILPFLLLGIGVDDTFVVMQSLENLSEGEKALDIPERIAKALQHSGSSITVTSVTNMMAFAIGISTSMPFLKSFCMFATTGILFLYIFEITFFVSCLVFDEKRVRLSKDGFCCKPQPQWRPNECSQKNLQRRILSGYIGPFLTKSVAKMLVLLLTASLATINFWGILQLEQNFDPLWYLDQNSYPIKYNEKLKEYFPKYGKRAGIYLTGIDYFNDRESLLQLVRALHDNPYVNSGTLDPWFLAYDQWLKDRNYELEDKDEYYSYLTEFLLLTKKGQSYIKDIKFNQLPVGDNYTIMASQIQIQHILINTTSNQVRAMQSVRDLIKLIKFQNESSHIAVFSKDYVTWTANKITGEELVRNLCLEVLAVGVITVMLIRNMRASFWVLCCVILTLIDLLGSMYFLGLTIEISSGIIVLLCAGLAVDYAAHVGMEFMRAKGTKNERLIFTLDIIGPAVLNGGLSTFLAFVMLSGSNSYLFTTFFKLFTTVVVFGLYHGLIFLPVILSLFGPNEKKERSLEKSNTIEQNGYRVTDVCSTSETPPEKQILANSTKTV